MVRSGKRVTSQDVAERAGVSRTTVSFVLNDVSTAKISKETRDRVVLAANELGYVPDVAARTLVSGKTGTLGLIVSHADLIPVDVFVAQMLHSLHDVCRENGYRLLLETAEFGTKPASFERLVRARRIDGLVILGPRPGDAALRTLIETGYPVVLIGQYDHPNACLVSQETDPSASAHATRHLISLGHTRIGFMHYQAPHGIEAADRSLGYALALQEAGIPLDPALIVPGDYSAASGYQSMTRLLRSGAALTALVCGNDTIAIGAMAAIAEAGLRIPDDISITGHDDIPNARYTIPPLTTVRIPAYAMGRTAGEMAVELMAGRPLTERQVVFPAELVIRASTAPPRV